MPRVVLLLLMLRVTDNSGEKVSVFWETDKNWIWKSYNVCILVCYNEVAYNNKKWWKL